MLNNDELDLIDDLDAVPPLVPPSRPPGAPRPGPHHWRQPSLAARRAGPTSIEAALGRVAASATSIRAYLDRLKQLEQWLNERLRVIDACLGRVRRVERAVTGVDTAPSPLPGDCQSHLLLVACYADLARQVCVTSSPSSVNSTRS